MTQPSEPNILALWEAYRKARESGDPAAIRAAARAVFAAAEADHLERVLAALRAASKELPDDAEPDAVKSKVADVYHSLDWPARRAILEGREAAREAPTVQWSGTLRNEPEPTPILWRDDPEANTPRDPVVSAGECAVLAGAGAAGKSWLTIRLAVEAARAAKAGEASGVACGLRVRADSVIIVSYEMSLKRIDMAAAAMGAPNGVPVLTSPPPLFPMDPTTRAHGEGPEWRRAWDALARECPSLIVFDTGPKAMGGADVNATAPVIAFLQAVEREVQAIGDCAALVVCHDTKAMRDGEEMGAGAIAGSGQWFDSPRGALHLSKVKGSDMRFLECIKASNGREHWGARLVPLWNTPPGALQGRYAGLQLDGDGARIEPGGMIAARKASARNDDDQHEQLDRLILGALASRPMNKTEVASIIHRKAQDVRQAMDALAWAGRIQLGKDRKYHVVVNPQ